MSGSLTSRSPDLSRLVTDGYEVAVISGHLVITNIPYVTRRREVAYGTIVSELTMVNDITVKPGTHVVYFSDVPCDANGVPLTKLVIQETAIAVADGITMQAMFSSKPVPPDEYEDYYRKMTTYIRAVSAHAEAIDPTVSARTYRVVKGDEDGVFQYQDTQSARLLIGTLTQRLAVESIAIVGVGGTGSYILDFLSKTPARAIHLYDADEFLQHNAFRTPSAAAGAELDAKPLKVEYLASKYTAMHRHVVPHGYALDETNISELEGVAFVFIAIDDAIAKAPIINFLDEHGIPYIDVGMGISEADGVLSGSLRTTFSHGDVHTRAAARARIATTGGGDGGDYDTNIQIAELNALNAALAVIRYKQHRGFYADLGVGEHSVYMLATNAVANEELEL